MNSKDVRALAKIMNEYGLSFIEWKDENSSITLKKDCLTGETVSKSVDSISNSNLGLIIGFALILFVFLKFGWDKVVRKKVD